MSDIQAITYDDWVNVTPVAYPKRIWTEPVAGFSCDVAGTIQVLTARKTLVTRTILAGIIYPIAILSVFSGGTTATGIAAVTTASAPYRGLAPQ